MLTAAVLITPMILAGASTGTTRLLRQGGSGAVTTHGDYIGSYWGMDSYYDYCLEVPAGLTTLTVELFDPDIYSGSHDRMFYYSTSVRYTLYSPSGYVTSASFSTSYSAYDNAWYTLYTTSSTPIPNGHWRLRVDMSSLENLYGDCFNGFGIRAHDGTPGAGGTEINIYADNFIPLGHIGSGGSTSTCMFPYITSGCTADWNDWDGDDYVTISYTSRTGNTTGSYSGSGIGVWLNAPVSGYTTDALSSDYGIWQTIATYSPNGDPYNFGVLYVGSYNAADPPPTTYSTNHFRIYLPTDAGDTTAPVKSYLAQKYSYYSGANPLDTGSTTRLKMEVTIVNPEALAITFSSSNLVTAYIPGSGVVYAGSASTTQGSVVSQPSVGGSGSITWNPGSVAGGTSATMTYLVDVTPTSDGQRLPLTGTPSANGTSATYVDITGNTSQLRATYTFGPICEVAATEGGGPVPTLASISSFRAFTEGGQVLVEWETTSEIGAAGFQLLRKEKEEGEYIPVSDEFLPALADAPQGGSYRLVDPRASSGETYWYKLVEIEAGGRSWTHGPFKVTVDGAGARKMRRGMGQSRNSFIPGYDPQMRELPPQREDRVHSRRVGLQRAKGLKQHREKGVAKIGVRRSGVVYLSDLRIAQALGIPQSQVGMLIRFQKLSLTNRGEPVAWMADPRGSGILFYGQALSSPYSDENVYWLEKGRGLSMEPVEGGLPLPAPSTQTFRETIHFEEDHIALMGLFKLPTDDYLLWDSVIAGSGAKAFSFNAPAASSSGTVQLTLQFKGATDTAASPDHHVAVKLNGAAIGECEWDATLDHTLTLSFDGSLLREGGNSLEISGLLDTGAPYSVFYLDSFDLTYNKRYVAAANALECKGDGNAVVTASGFGDSNLFAWEVSDPRQPKVVSGVTIDPTNHVSFVPASPESRYLVFSVAGALAPASFDADVPTRLKSRQNGADYVIVVPGELRDGVDELAAFHRGKGHTVLVAELEDIYDEFNWGIASPLAIKEFLAYAYENWRGAKPEFALLVGKGTYDYKDSLGKGDNLVPVILSGTSYGIFASDAAFGAVGDEGRIPRIAVGRLPVVNAEELSAMVAKIKIGDGGSGAWTKRVLMIADNPDESGDFPAQSDDFAGLMTGYSITKAYLTGSATPQEVKSKIIDGINAGCSLVNFIGHAGLIQLTSESILTVDDLASLQNEGMLPVFSLLSCVVGRFEIPGIDTLSEALLLKPKGGALAVLAPSGASIASQANLLAEEFFKAVYQENEKVLGRAWLKAVNRYAQKGYDLAILDIYNLIGDPAVIIK